MVSSCGAEMGDFEGKSFSFNFTNIYTNLPLRLIALQLSAILPPDMGIPPLCKHLAFYPVVLMQSPPAGSPLISDSMSIKVNIC
jgi:hypothetical protein